MNVHIGTSGWNYPAWRGRFYPAGLRDSDELAVIGRHFPTVEVNATFYGLPAPAVFRRWAASVPAGFRFSVKASRYLTHIRRLRDPRESLAYFFASGVLLLGEKLGPILWQLPPGLPFDAGRLEAFFACLPATDEAAARLARAHGPPRRHRACFGPLAGRAVRHALEPRHASFAAPACLALCRQYQVALVKADAPDRPAILPDLLTTDFGYGRVHGGRWRDVTGCTNDELSAWAGTLDRWRQAGAREAFVYFNNDAAARAPADARRLCRLVGG